LEVSKLKNGGTYKWIRNILLSVAAVETADKVSLTDVWVLGPKVSIAGEVPADVEAMTENLLKKAK
jgi:hypothetical protein